VQIKFERTAIRDAVIVIPEVFQDARGFFTEVYRADQFAEAGLPTNFVQWNHSRSAKGVVRGLHFQWDPPMGKLARVTAGEAFLVAVDIRKDSPTLGKHVALVASAENKKALWAPASFGRGFAVLSDYSEIEYLTTGVYNAKAESGVRWNDPALGIQWPVTKPILSGKDEKAQTLSEWLTRAESEHFRY
jgi:dTDP-4-dehydrorhamnose 3,5-epimerase